MSTLVPPRRTRAAGEATSTVSPQWASIKVSREAVIQRWDRRHSTDPPPSSAEAGEIRMYRPLEPGPASSETVLIGGSGGAYSSPFQDDGRGGDAVEAYRQWLTGSHTAGALGRAHSVSVHKAWRVGPRVLEGRLAALLRLVARVRRGERLQLVCACSVHTVNSCHGDVIVDWVRGRLRPD